MLSMCCTQNWECMGWLLYFSLPCLLFILFDLGRAWYADELYHFEENPQRSNQQRVLACVLSDSASPTMRCNVATATDAVQSKLC